MPALADEVARYYPNAVRTPIVAPNAAHALVEQFTLEQNVLAERRGIDARYRAPMGRASSAANHPPTSRTYPSPRRPTCAWRGGLTIDQPGSYVFHPPDGFTLDLDGARLDGAGGAHARQPRLRAAWHRRSGRQTPVAVAPARRDGDAAWSTRTRCTSRPTAAMASRRLSIRPRPGRARRAKTVIDPIVDHYFHVNPFARLNFDPHSVWSAEWRARFEAPTTGTYRFEAERLSRAGLWIDDRLVFDDTANDARR